MDNTRQKAIEEIASRPELKDRVDRHEMAGIILDEYLEKVENNTLYASNPSQPKGFF